MAANKNSNSGTVVDRKLGDEWAGWSGEEGDFSTDTDGRAFIGLSIATIVAILGVTALFGWLIFPRLNQLGSIYGLLFNGLYFSLAAVLIIWLLLFIIAGIFKRPFLSTWIIIPKLVNLLLEFTLRLGKVIGFSHDRMFNSFLKLHNLIISSDPKRVAPDRLLLLLPRCLTREMNQGLRKIKNKYSINLSAAGGGGEARRKIKELRPGLVIAIACERDLLLGFIEVNPHIPVICFPNIRPCGPCKNTEVDLDLIEATIKRHLQPPK